MHSPWLMRHPLKLASRCSSCSPPLVISLRPLTLSILRCWINSRPNPDFGRGMIDAYSAFFPASRAMSASGGLSKAPIFGNFLQIKKLEWLPCSFNLTSNHDSFITVNPRYACGMCVISSPKTLKKLKKITKKLVKTDRSQVVLLLCNLFVM